MSQINFKGLPENITIGEMCDMEKQVKNLPEGFKITYSKPKVQTAEELIDENKEHGGTKENGKFNG